MEYVDAFEEINADNEYGDAYDGGNGYFDFVFHVVDTESIWFCI